jgi:luciferase family oxidoreductase group 1
MYPDRIDLGLGRAPGTDQETVRALRRDPAAADTFPQDLLELQGYLTGRSRVPGVQAIPGKDSHVPLYILGSSLFGAQLAAALGLPYAFASHFAPAALEPALTQYRTQFRPSEQLDRPYAIAAINVLAADSTALARDQLLSVRRARAIHLFGGQLGLSRDDKDTRDEVADHILASGAGAHVDDMLRHTAVGTPDEVRDQVDAFARLTGADEFMTVHQASNVDDRLRSIALLADAFE